jgi:hypothetical protein
MAGMRGITVKLSETTLRRLKQERAHWPRVRTLMARYEQMDTWRRR